MGSFTDGGQQRLPGILADDAQQLAQGKNGRLAAVFLESADIVGDFRHRLEDERFLRMRVGPLAAPATLAAVFSQQDVPILRFGHALVRNKVAGIELDLDLIFAFTHLDTTAKPVNRNRVAIAVERDIAFHVHHAFMQPIDLRNPRREWSEMLLLHHEQLPRYRVQMLLVRCVDAIAPGTCLLVQILPVGKGAARQEVALYEPEGPLHACRTIRIAQLMSYETSAVTLGKRRHLRHRNHLSAGAAQHYYVRVIDHQPFRRTTEIAQRLGQKNLAVETLEGWIQLEEQHVRVTQHCRGSLYLAPLAAQFNLMWRRVVLNFFAGEKAIASRRHLRHLTDAIAPAEGGQRLITQSHSAGLQLLPHAHQVALAAYM